MARTRSTTTPRARRSTAGSRGSGGGSQLANLAQQVVDQIDGLTAEIETLRSENDALRADLSGAVTRLEQATDTLAGASRSGRRGRRAAPPAPRTRTRVTPEGVTPDVVHTVIANLGGEATAAEIAAEITRAGTPVSGRAVRFLAERAGAERVTGEDGQHRYRVS
jgi:cell division septum initiation protein DivIVA